VPFAAPVLGLGILLMAPMMPCSQSWCGAPAFFLLILGIITLAVGIVFLFKPPSWTKPRWLLEMESNGWDGYVEAKRPRIVTVAGVVALVACIFLLASGNIPISVGALVAGLAFALLEWRHQRSVKNSR
jgi:hypothetical protein